MVYNRVKIQIDYKKINGIQDGYAPYMDCYLHSKSPEINRGEKRTAIVICPGGAYYFKSDREAEPIALRYLSYGLQAFVLQYSVSPSRFPCAMLELAEAVRIVRRHAEEWDIDRIVICGFSAGGHLCASLGTMWSKDVIKQYFDKEYRQCKPDGMILAYPVITMGEYTHEESRENLLKGTVYTAEDTSIEYCVSEDTIPAFVWSTFEDTAVPCENSLLFCQAMRRFHIPFELHIYEKGEHGIALADRETLNEPYQIQPDNANWVEMSVRWINRLE